VEAFRTPVPRHLTKGEKQTKHPRIPLDREAKETSTWQDTFQVRVLLKIFRLVRLKEKDLESQGKGQVMSEFEEGDERVWGGT